MLKNKKGHFTPIATLFRVVTIALLLILLDMATRGELPDPGIVGILATVGVITTMASFIPI